MSLIVLLSYGLLTSLSSLELYFRDSRSLLVVFPKRAERQATNERLQYSISGRSVQDSLTPGGGGLLKSPLVNRLSARVSATARASAKVMGFRLDELSTAQRRWQAREISNVSLITWYLSSSLIDMAIVCLHQYSESAIWPHSQ